MFVDAIAHLSADAWELLARFWRFACQEMVLFVLGAFWSPSEVEAYRQEWREEVRRG